MRRLIWPAGEATLLPAIVQHARSLQVLMLAYMNREAFERTLDEGRVTFFSRSRQKLWTKGETSGNTLSLVDARFDCDADTLLIRALPAGPACHLGTTSCFGTETAPGIGFLEHLDEVVRARRDAPPESSYTASLFAAGLERIAQKVGEEGVETVIAAVSGDRAGLVGESADLLYHLLVLLQISDVPLDEVVEALRARHAQAAGPRRVESEGLGQSERRA